MSVARLKALIETCHGMRLDALTEDRLRRILDQDAAEAGRSADAQARRVALDPALRQKLLDRTTLQESSFFRDPPVFAALARHVLPEAIRAAAGKPLVVWSAGCADGQEAWSLAMLLRELGAPRFEVVASDLSAAATRRAAEGSYEERELRGLDPARRARHMVRDGSRWRVADALRQHVRVVRRNAATEPAPVTDGSCALVLCRYVLIYLTPSAADALLTRIAATLRPEGHLVIGAAESLWYLTDRFSPEPLPRAVAYRRRRPDDEAGPGGALPLIDDAAQRLPRASARRGRLPGAARREAPTTLHAETGPRTVPSAAAPDARALMRDGDAAAAAGDLAAAAAAFRGATYLAPDDAVPLVQLGLVLEAQEDPGAERVFRSAWSALGRQPAGALEADLGGFAAASLVRLVAGKLAEFGDPG